MVVAAERTRLTSQADRILALLKAGPASNTMLAAISLKYTSRISDLRKRGHAITVVERNYETGEVTYALGASM